MPRQWKVIQTVREKFTCRACEKITQPPAPFHPIPRGHAGPSLLAMILYAKFGEHQPLNRQSESYRPRGHRSRRLDAGRSGRRLHRRARPACRADPPPRVAAERIHGDDTTVPVLAKGKTVTGRLWTYVRDDRPFAGPDPPAAVFFYSRNRGGEHPARHLAGYAGILQADAYAGFGDLYDGKRKTGPDHRGGVLEPWPPQVLRAGRSAQGAAGGRGGAAHRRDLRHRARDQRPAGRRPAGGAAGAKSRRSSPISKHGCAPNAPGCRATPTTAKAMDYMLKRWPAFTRFLDDGRICLTNNAAERALRGIALGRRGLAVRRLRSRRRARRGNVHADRHRQAQRHRPRKPGSPTCSPASPIIPPPGSTSSCPGTGRRPGIKPPREHRPAAVLGGCLR